MSNAFKYGGVDFTEAEFLEAEKNNPKKYDEMKDKIAAWEAKYPDYAKGGISKIMNSRINNNQNEEVNSYKYLDKTKGIFTGVPNKNTIELKPEETDIKNTEKEDKNLNFEQIINSISDADMMKSYDGLTLDDFASEKEESVKRKTDLDNKTLSEEEQRFNLAFWAKATMSHVGWGGFGEDNQNNFKKAVEKLYNQIDGTKNQKEFMNNVAADTMSFIQDRHYMLMTGSGVRSGGGKKEKPDVGRNIGYGKDYPEGYEKVDSGTDNKDLPLWEIGKITKNDEDILIVSLPNLGTDGSYEYWEKFVKTFDEEYAKISNNENSRIILDVRGNGGGEDKPIDHVAKRLYGNMVNTYKRCEINDSAISNKFLHDHGAYKQENYEKDGIKREDLVERKHFSNKNKVLFDETQTYYPFNEEKGYKGRIDVLIDRGVGSSAESAYTSFYHHPRTRYIGENTAGKQQFTQGSFAMPCGYLMRIGVTKLTYWDKTAENIDVKEAEIKAINQMLIVRGGML